MAGGALKSLILSLAIIALVAMMVIPVQAYHLYIPGPASIPINHDKILMIVSNWPTVLQGHVYYFQLRTFDDNQVTKTTPLEEFKLDQGDLQGVLINATLYNYDNATVLHKFSGVTNQFGWFEGSVLMENEMTDKVYNVVFNAAFPHMVNSTKTFSFELISNQQVGESS